MNLPSSAGRQLAVGAITVLAILALAGCESAPDAAAPAAIAPAAELTAGVVRSGDTVAIRASGSRAWWFVRTGVSFNPDAPNAKGPDVVFTASTGPDRFVVEKVHEGSSAGTIVESGDFVRLNDVEHEGWLEANIDNPLFVVSDPRLHDNPNARFLIQKVAGSDGRQVRKGDVFILRGINGEPWLVAPVEGVIHVSSDPAMATPFEFAPQPKQP